MSGVDSGAELAEEVAAEMTARTRSGAHARDELGLSRCVECAAGPGRIGLGGELRGRCGVAAGAAVLAPSNASLAIAVASPGVACLRLGSLSA